MNNRTIMKDGAVGLISVITPVFNGEKYLGRCVDSVLSQTYRHWELLLINDGSSDRSAEICDQYAASDSRVSVFHTANRGPAVARNTGMEKAGGQFYVFLDADDTLASDALSQLTSKYLEEQVDMVISGFNETDENGTVKKQEPFSSVPSVLPRSEILSYLRRYLQKPNRMPVFSYVWGKIYNAAVIKKHHLLFNPELHVFEDTDFNFRYLKYVDKAACLGACVYNYTSGHLSATTGSTEFHHKMFDPLQAMRSLGELFLPETPDRPIELVIGHACISLAIIQSVRICGQMTRKNRKIIKKLLEDMVNYPLIRNSLPYYAPTGRDSRLLPYLIKFKIIWAITAVCKYKAHKRYGKLWKQK